MDVIYLNDNLKIVPEKKPELPQCMLYISMFVHFLLVHVRATELRIDHTNHPLEKLEYLHLYKILHYELTLYRNFQTALADKKHEDIIVTNGCTMKERMTTYEVRARRAEQQFDATGIDLFTSEMNGTIEAIQILDSIMDVVVECLLDMEEEKPAKESVFKRFVKWCKK